MVCPSATPDLDPALTDRPASRLHRLACFRDDVVFLILLYQRWIYRVDKSRANEVRLSLSPPSL